MNKNLDVYVVMHIGSIVSRLYRTNEIPFDTAYDDIVDLVEKELSTDQFYKYLDKELNDGGDTPTAIENWFTPKIIEFANQ